MTDLEAKTPMYPADGNGYDYDHLDTSQLPIEVDVPDIAKYPNEVYALLRKHGLGTSDSSVLCNVNPYTSIPELVQEKARGYLTEEEKAVGNKVAVRKGRDLEPFIIKRFSELMKVRVLKPSDMYRHRDIPWLKFNYDGVIDKVKKEDGTYQYIPAEIKVVTAYGIKHYDITKAYYRESVGFMNMPEDHSKENNTIETKAAEYGIPAYYYTQLQQEIFGLDAKFGYLTVLFDSTWEMVSYFIWRDDACISQILTNGAKVWSNIKRLTGDPKYEDTSKLIRDGNFTRSTATRQLQGSAEGSDAVETYGQPRVSGKNGVQ